MSRFKRNVLIAGAAVCGLAAAAAIVWLSLGPEVGPHYARATGDRNLRSIAVLPFETRAAEGDIEGPIFSNGLRGDLLTEFARFSALKVISHSSTEWFRRTKLDARQIGARLAVSTILEGRVDVRRDRVRVTVRLIDTESGRRLWEKTYDEPLSALSIPAIRADVVQHVAETVGTVPTSRAAPRIAAPVVGDSLAYDRYVRGQYYWSKKTLDAFETAIDYFHEAIAHDSAQAPAYTGIAETYYYLVGRGHLSRQEAVPRIRDAAERALELDPSQADALTLLAVARLWSREWDGAEHSFRRAIELNPSQAIAHRWYAKLLVQTGRTTEALNRVGRAHELDPLHGAINAELAAALRYNGQYLESLWQADHTIEMSPTFAPAHLERMLAFAQLGQLDEALVSARRAAEAAPAAASAVPLAHYLRGEDELALEYLRRLIERLPDDGPSYRILARVQARTGRFDEADAALRRATELDAGDPFGPVAAARVLAAIGHPAAAREILSEVEAFRDDPAWTQALPDMAAAHVTLGDFDRAFDLLEEAVTRNADTWGLRSDPDLDPLRDDPRFDALLRRVGLDDAAVDSIMARYRVAAE